MHCSPVAAVVARSQSRDSGRKPQPTLHSLWGTPGPAVSQHRSPQWLARAAQWEAEERAREQSRCEKEQSAAGQLVVAPVHRVHTGGSKGGRPKVGAVRGVRAGFKSNIRELGQSRLRRDPTVQERMAIFARVESLGKDPSAIGSHARREVEKWCGFSWKVIQTWYKRKEEYEAQFSKLRLGKWGLRPFGSTVALTKKSKSSGARLRFGMNKGGYQSEAVKWLKIWFDEERRHGHEVSRSMMFDFYVKFLERSLAYKRTQFMANPSDTVLPLHIESLQSRLSRMEKRNKEVQKYFQHTIIPAVGAVFRKPQRKTRLSPVEEQLRVELTWQGFDRAQWVAMYGTDSDLLEHCKDPQQWREKAWNTVWIFWDHVPVWLLCTGEERTLFSSEESNNWSARKRLSKKVKAQCAEYYDTLQSGSADAQSECLVQLKELYDQAREAAKQSSNTVQTRGVYSQGGDKYRLTLILFQSIEGWFDQSQTPRGFAAVRSQKKSAKLPDLQGVLLVHGSVHCRLEDLDASGKYKKAYKFNSGGTMYQRHVGQSARGLLNNWVKLRESLGEEQFLKLRVWSQPAAWADEIISCWISDLLKQYVYQSINAIDCFSGQWTENALHTSWLNSQMQIPIGPDCTPLLQLTDTLCSFTAKRRGEEAKEAVALQLREKARRENTTYKAKFGHSGLWEVAKAMAADGSVRQSERDGVLTQAVKSQLLVWRPGAEGLEPIESQSWSAVYPRLPFQSGLQADWVETRSKHMPDGPAPVPPVPDWDQLNTPLLHDQCLSVEPAKDDFVLSEVSGAIMDQLSDHQRDMLRSPQERWALLQLPSTLKSQKSYKSASNKKCKWSRKLQHAWSSGKSQRWKAAKGKPVPTVKGSKKSVRSEAKHSILWKGAKSKKLLAVKPDAPVVAICDAPVEPEVVVAALHDAQPVPLGDSAWVGMRVRTVCDRLPRLLWNRVWTVHSVEKVLGDGDLQLRLKDDSYADGQALASQVVDCSLDKHCVAPGPVTHDYRVFKGSVRAAVAVELYRKCGGDVMLVEQNSMVEAQTVQYAIRELMNRLPCAAVRVMTPHECSSVFCLDSEDGASGAEQLALLQSELDQYTHIFALLHSHNPKHYTLLERSPSGDGHQLRYWDSLRNPSASALKQAQCLVDKLQWGLQVPRPCNGRFQSDGWSCGLWCVQFLDEAVRKARNEPIHLVPVHIPSVIGRVNRWITAVKEALPASARKASAPNASSSEPIPIADIGPPVPTVAKSGSSGTAKTLRATPSDPSKISYVPDEDFTLDMASAAAAVHSKCRQKGCAECMRQYFIPKKFWKQWAKETATPTW